MEGEPCFCRTKKSLFVTEEKAKSIKTVSRVEARSNQKSNEVLIIVVFEKIIFQDVCT